MRLSACCVRTISIYWERVRFSDFAKRSSCFFSVGETRDETPTFRHLVGFFGGGMAAPNTLTSNTYTYIT